MLSALIVLIAIVACASALFEPTATPSVSPQPAVPLTYQSTSGFQGAVPSTGGLIVTFATNTTVGGFNETSPSYSLQLYDLQESTFDSKGNVQWIKNTQILLSFTTVQQALNKNTFVSTAQANARYQSLTVTNKFAQGANQGSFETTIAINGYQWTQNNTESFLSLRFYLTGGDKCKVNTECNASAVIVGATNQSGVLVNEAVFFTTATANVGNNVTAVKLTYTSGAAVLSYAYFNGDLSHDPTTALTYAADAPATVEPVNLQSTWWFGWSYTTWYIILAVVGVIVLLALVALIGAIIVWNRGKPGYEQV